MIELLQSRLASYRAVDSLAEEQALKELLQELILYALWRNDFFELAAFQGETCLRILYGLPRFSEDMDFILLEPDESFEWRLLCRPYLKGCDWFDFLWYVRRGIVPNLSHLGNALEQYGPWAGQGIQLDWKWLKQTMTARIDSIDWAKAAADVEPFVTQRDRHALELWGRELFLDRLGRMQPG